MLFASEFERRWIHVHIEVFLIEERSDKQYMNNLTSTDTPEWLILLYHYCIIIYFFNLMKMLPKIILCVTFSDFHFIGKVVSF